MKNYLIISLLFFLLSCSQKEYHVDDLMKTDNELFIEKFIENGKPVTGKVYQFYGKKSNRKKVYNGNVINGKMDGRWVDWYDNGKKYKIRNFKNGELDGLVTIWYDNGQMKMEGTYKGEDKDGYPSFRFTSNQLYSQ